MILFTNNPMLSATANSYPKALRISTYHDKALAAGSDNPRIASLSESYHPVHLRFKAAYDDWKSRGYIQRGSTLSLNQLLRLLSGPMIDDWHVRIQNKYKKDTKEYTILFPDDRMPFQHGSQGNRLRAVEALSNAAGKYTSLNDIKAEIDAFKDRLREALELQKGNISKTRGGSEEVEIVRVEMCTAQYANLGSLMNQYASHPKDFLRFFDLSVLGKTRQTFFTRQVKPQKPHTILKHIFDSNEELTLANTGNTILWFYLAGERNMKPGDTYVALSPGKKTVLASELGNLANPFLVVYNTDAFHTGSFEVEIG